MQLLYVEEDYFGREDIFVWRSRFAGQTAWWTEDAAALHSPTSQQGKIAIGAMLEVSDSTSILFYFFRVDDTDGMKRRLLVYMVKE